MLHLVRVVMLIDSQSNNSFLFGRHSGSFLCYAEITQLKSSVTLRPVVGSFAFTLTMNVPVSVGVPLMCELTHQM